MVNFDLLIDLLRKAQSQQNAMNRLSDDTLHILMSTSEAVSEESYHLKKPTYHTILLRIRKPLKYVEIVQSPE